MTTQISLSFELICLISWLLKNDKAMINTLVKHALDNGFVEEIAKIDAENHGEVAENMYSNLVTFLEYLEKTLLKNLENVQFDHKTKDAIFPTLQKLETDNLDFKTMWLSMQQTKARVSRANPKVTTLINNPSARQRNDHIVSADAAGILFEELLKHWKPNNKETVN